MSTPDEPRERWEYTILFLTADPRAQQDFFDTYASGQKVFAWDIRALIPQLNDMGMQGWDLVTLFPATIASNGLVSTHHTNIEGVGNLPSPNTFLCTFKRRVR